MITVKKVLSKLSLKKFRFWVIFLLVLNCFFLVRIYFAIGHPYLSKQKSRPTGIYAVLSLIGLSTTNCISQYDIPDYTNSLDEIQNDLMDIKTRVGYIESALN